MSYSNHISQKFNVSECLKVEAYSDALTTACKMHDLEIVRYLVEEVGINSVREISIGKKSPIVEAILISSDLQVEQKEIEREKSLQVVQYLLERENRSSSELLEVYQPKSIIQYSSRDIVRIAYENANIPVLQYLKQLGFVMTKFRYLSDAVKSKDITSVKYYWNEVKQSPPSDQSDKLYSIFRSIKSPYLNAILDSLTEPTLEIFNTFSEFGIDITTQYPEVLIAGRFELLDQNHFRFERLENHELSDDYSVDEIFKKMLSLLLQSKNLCTEYLAQLFSRFQKFKTYVDCHIDESLLSILSVCFILHIHFLYL